MSNSRLRAFDSGNAVAPRPRTPLFALTAALARRALPQRCALCIANADGALLCAACSEALPRLSSACPLCALPSPRGAPCAACVASAPPFAAAIAALVYAHPVDRLLHAFKYRGQLALADWAALAVASAVRKARAAGVSGEAVDGVVALPLAPARQRERGFNQAREIAVRVARELELPMRAALVRGGGAGPPQAVLAARQRRRNVQGSFAACADVRGARLALIDDVMTTGATLAAATAALRDAGAARVECWVVARALPPALP